MTENILFGKEARESLMKGIKLLSEAVIQTLGPGGRNVILGGALPRSSRDGVSVANNIIFTNRAMNQGAFLMKQAAGQTLESCGDGTTTSTLLAYRMIQLAENYLESGANPNELKRGIDMAVEQVVEQIQKQAIPCDTNEKIKFVATISGNNDEFIGGIVAEAYEKIGEGGLVTLTDSKTSETYVEVTKGMEVESGFISPRFVNTPKFTCELENVAVILCAQEIKRIEGKPTDPKTNTPGTGLLGVLEHAMQEGINVLVIAKEVDGEVIAALYTNKDNLRSCAVRAPHWGTMQREYLDDIAAVTGATVIDEEMGTNTKEMVWEHVGYAKSVVVDRKSCRIIGGAGDPTKRALVLRSEFDLTKDQHVGRRLARLTGGVAVIYAGGATEVEQRETKDRLDDSYKAAKVAIEEGIVEGGGCALLRCRPVYPQGGVGDFINGMAIVEQAIREPFKQILSNAGIEGVEAIESKVTKSKEGYNAKTKQFESLMETGVIDPVKVVVQSLKNAASVAGIVILTGAVVIDTQE